jgi:hypothetical protein
MLSQNKKYLPVLIAVVFSLVLLTTNSVLACCKPQDCSDFGEPITLCLDEDGDGYGNLHFKIQRCPEESEVSYVINCTDNCPQVFNPDQIDTNGNGIGDACESAEPPTSQLPACCPFPDFKILSLPNIFVKESAKDLRLTWEEAGGGDKQGDMGGLFLLFHF